MIQPPVALTHWSSQPSSPFISSRQVVSIEEELLGKASLDVGAHESDFEFKEGDLAGVVGVEPIKHLLQQDFFLFVSERLAERADERLAHRLAFIEVEPSVAIGVSFTEGFLDEAGELLRHPLHLLLLELRRLVNEVVEHELLVEVDADELRRRRLHDILDTLGEACLDLNVNLHADRLCRLRGHLKAPDEDFRLVRSRAHKELIAFVSLFSHNHR